MGFFSKLLGKSDWKKTLIRDLVTLTAVDGDMDKEEIALALKIATNDLGFTEQKFVDLMQNLGDVDDVYPSESQDKLDYIQYLLEMTYADGYVDDNEIEYMKLIAKRMNLPTDSIDKAIAYIEESTNKLHHNEDGFSDDSSINKIIITSPYEPTVDVQSVDGVNDYVSQISNLSRVDLCIELSNVMASKHNLMAVPSGINSFANNQSLVTDLTDKATWICILAFGQETVMNYCNQDLRIFNELVNNIDAEVAQLQLAPSGHGKKLLNKLHENLN